MEHFVRMLDADWQEKKPKLVIEQLQGKLEEMPEKGHDSQERPGRQQSYRKHSTG